MNRGKVKNKYRGRCSLPKTNYAYTHMKKRKSRQKSPRHKDYLDEIEEYNVLYRCLDNVNPMVQNVSDFPTSSTDTSICDKIVDVVDQLRKEFELFGQSKTSVHLKVANTREAFLVFNDGEHKFGDVLWLHLQTYFANRPVSKKLIRRSLAIQDRYILEMRNKLSDVIDDIRAFSIENYAGDLSKYSVYLIYDAKYNLFLSSVMDRVRSLLNRWERLCELYPTVSAMKSIPQLSSIVMSRITLLYMWYNNVNSLLHTINETGNYLDFIGGSRNSGNLICGLMKDDSCGRDLLRSSNTHLWPLNLISPNQSHNSLQSSSRHSLLMSDLESTSTFLELFSEIYRKVVGRSLRLRGMLEVLSRLKSLCKNTMEKACLALLVPRLYAQIVGSAESAKIITQLRRKYGVCDRGLEETVNCAEFKAMNLPTFYPFFIFLLRIAVDLVHQWLQTRSEKVISFEWDLLTLNTLIEDSHDCLEAAIKVKNGFIDFVTLITADTQQELACLENFDSKLTKVFQNYLDYVRFWAQTAARPTNSEIDWSERVIAKLTKEWKNAKRWSISVCRGEVVAARKFCSIGNDLLDVLVKRYLTEKFDAVELGMLDVHDLVDDDDYILVDDGNSTKTSSIFVLCRAFKDMIRNLRERSLKSLVFVRSLCSELEICVRYTWNSGPNDEQHNCDELFCHLLNSDHIVIHFSDYTDCSFVVLCSRDIADEFDYIDALLSATCYSSRVRKAAENSRQSLKKVERGYLLIIPSNRVSSAVLGQIADHHTTMTLSTSTKTTLHHYTSMNGIYLISESREVLEVNRRRFERTVNKFLMNFDGGQWLECVDDYCSCNDELFEEIAELKRVAFETVQDVWAYARDLGQYVLNGRRMEDLQKNECDSLKVTLLQAWNAAFECHKELSKIISLSMYRDFYVELTSCINFWSEFLIQTINETNAAPRWAMTPLNYLLNMPNHIFQSNKLGSAEVENLLRSVHACVEHIKPFTKYEHPSYTHLQDLTSSVSFVNEIANLDLDSYYSSKKMSVTDRVNRNIDELERRRQAQLIEQRKIGKVVEANSAHSFNSIFFPSKKVPFEWQRLENRSLGSGSFGTVFLVMNLKDKCLMAMKQIHIRRENNDSLKALVEEVDILRHLDHPNLVKYYGVEVHKEELMIFMEYCSEGTLARVCREGLELNCVRRYTHYLLQAVSYIHSHHIVHRDIKPDNIFLGRKNVLKLGDFGCSFRLRGTNTMFGELTNHVGTPMYMAPEIQTNGGLLVDELSGDGNNNNTTTASRAQYPFTEYVGYGRAVDIWSTGCVVLEMLTGKKPYHYLNHELQIIYHLGSGIQPRIPNDIQKCAMSYSFLQLCLSVNPNNRPSAQELLQHPFANIMPQAVEHDSQGQCDSQGA